MRMLLLAALENVCFRQLVDTYRLVGLFDLIRRKRGWGKMHRRGLAGS